MRDALDEMEDIAAVDARERRLAAGEAVMIPAAFVDRIQGRDQPFLLSVADRKRRSRSASTTWRRRRVECGSPATGRANYVEIAVSLLQSAAPAARVERWLAILGASRSPL
jgi:hypothetical protein